MNLEHLTGTERRAARNALAMLRRRRVLELAGTRSPTPLGEYHTAPIGSSGPRRPSDLRLSRVEWVGTTVSPPTPPSFRAASD